MWLAAGYGALVLAVRQADVALVGAFEVVGRLGFWGAVDDGQAGSEPGLVVGADVLLQVGEDHAQLVDGDVAQGIGGGVVGAFGLEGAFAHGFVVHQFGVGAAGKLQGEAVALGLGFVGDEELKNVGERNDLRIVPLPIVNSFRSFFEQAEMQIVNNGIASKRRQYLKDDFDLKEHQIEALQLTAERQNYPVYEIFGDVTAVLASGFFDTETVIRDFTSGQNVRLVHGLYQMQISKKIDEQKDAILFKNGLEIGLELLNEKNIHRGFKL